jgi:chromate transporter
MIALFLRFFLIGILTIGGGLVAIPLLYQTFVVGEVISEALFYYMLSVSESTPGPIAINLATFIGYQQFGIIGSVLATYAFVAPSVIILWLIFPFYERIKHKPYVQHGMLLLKAAVLGLIMVTIYRLFDSIYSDNPIVTVLVGQGLLLAIFPFIKKYPQVLLALGAVFGVIFLR